MSDLTVVYYTASYAPENFLARLQFNLANVTKGLKERYVYQDKNVPRSHLNIYRNALIGAKSARTKYIALCEDDVLYHKSHFDYRPPDGVFGYNMNVWSIYTWVKPAIFSYKDRRNLSQLICERDLFIEAMEERFAKYTDDVTTPIERWAEPGKYEGLLGVTERKSAEFYSEMPNVAFSHETALSFLNLGKRKKLGNLKALEIPYWGKAEDVLKYYE